MSSTHIFFLGLFATALIGALGWLVTVAYQAFKNLIETVGQILIRLEATITRMDERYASQTNFCNDHRRAISNQFTETKEKIEKVEEKIEKVEEKIDKHIVNHPTAGRKRA